jgi:hypothetical protein
MTAFRLLDDFQRGYVKFDGREPRTLAELAIARADYEHRRRVAEIKAMAKKLALLDELLPALAERGIRLNHREITSHDRGATLRIHEPIFERDDKMHAALLELGFKEVGRTDFLQREDHIKLQRGRWLVVEIAVSKPAAAGASKPE